MSNKRRMPIRVNKNTYATPVEGNVTRVECIYGDAADTVFDVLVGQLFMSDFNEQDNNEAFYSYCTEEGSLMLSEDKKQIGFTMRFNTIKTGMQYYDIFRNTLAELFDVMYCMRLMNTINDGIEDFDPKNFLPEPGPFSTLFSVYSIRMMTESKNFVNYFCDEANKFLDYIRKNYNREHIDEILGDYIQNKMCVKRKLL